MNQVNSCGLMGSREILAVQRENLKVFHKKKLQLSVFHVQKIKISLFES